MVEEGAETITGVEEVAHEGEARLVAEVGVGAVTHDRSRITQTKSHVTKATSDAMNAKSFVIMHRNAKERNNRTKK